MIEEELSWSAARRHTSSSSTTPTVHHSYAEVARSSVHPAPLTSANCISIGPRKDQVSVFNRILFPRVSVFQRLEPNVHEKRHKHSESEMILGFLQRCPRCLSTGHRREACRWPILCYACHAAGHVAASCTEARFKAPRVAAIKDHREINLIKERGKANISNEKAAMVTVNDWFGKPPGLGLSKPPIFNSLGEWWKPSHLPKPESIQPLQSPSLGFLCH